MSGGHFNYKQYEIKQIADEIEQLIIDNDDQTKDQWGDTKGYGFEAQTIEQFKKALKTLRQAYVYAQILLMLFYVMSIAWACLPTYAARLFFKPR